MDTKPFIRCNAGFAAKPCLSHRLPAVESGSSPNFTDYELLIFHLGALMSSSYRPNRCFAPNPLSPPRIMLLAMPILPTCLNIFAICAYWRKS